jgi:hypothetical protein
VPQSIRRAGKITSSPNAKIRQNPPLGGMIAEKVNVTGSQVKAISIEPTSKHA